MDQHFWNERRSPEEAFLDALKAFTTAGQALCEAWDDGDFNADEAAPLPERIRPPMSLDEWLDELQAHYEEALR